MSMVLDNFSNADISETVRLLLLLIFPKGSGSKIFLSFFPAVVRFLAPWLRKAPYRTTL